MLIYVSTFITLRYLPKLFNLTDPERSWNATTKLSMYVDLVALRPTRSGFIHSFYFFTLLYYCRAIFNLSFIPRSRDRHFLFLQLSWHYFWSSIAIFQITHVQYRVVPRWNLGWSWANIYGSSVGWLKNTKISTQPICYQNSIVIT